MVEKVLQINRDRTIFWTLLGILFLCASFYMYFIKSTINNVVARQNFENEASGLTLKIGSQEFDYIAKKNAVTIELAYSTGFRDVEVKSYISKKPNHPVAFLSR